MPKSIAAVLEEAQSVLRSGGLARATRLIQAALTGSLAATGAAGAAPHRSGHPGPDIELKVVRTGADFEGLRRRRTPADYLTAGHADHARGAGTKQGRADTAGYGQFLTRQYTGEAGSRPYKLYVPSAPARPGRPLLVMLHGCTQDPDDFAAGTRMNDLAEAAGMVVLYPQQVASANPSKCWNWFDPAHQTRGGGEPALIAGIVAEVVREHEIDATRIFAAGLSAGGAMAVVLAETYPDVYAAVGVHSGLPYRAARDVVSAFQAMRGRGAAAAPAGGGKAVRRIVFHGDRDATVHPGNGLAVASPGRGTVDARRPSRKEGSIGGRSYRRTYLPAAPGLAEVEHWEVEGLGHAWSGGSSRGSYADPKGPDASAEMLRFFLGTPVEGS